MHAYLKHRFRGNASLQAPPPRGCGVGLFIGLLITLAHLSGCAYITSNAPQPEAPEAHSEAVAEPLSNSRRDSAAVQDLLALAQEALAAQRLTTPSATSAFTYFSRILDLAPGHPLARAGLEQIVEQYIAWALTAIAERRYSDATRFLERAALIHPKSPDIAATAEQLREKRQQAVMTEVVPTWVKEAHKSNQSNPNMNELVSDYFLQISNKIDDLNAKVTLFSRSDAEGRWLYQQLNQGTKTRLRASLRIDRPTRIELHFLPEERILSAQ